MYTSAGAVSCCSEVPWQGASCLLHGHHNDDKLDSVSKSRVFCGGTFSKYRNHHRHDDDDDDDDDGGGGGGGSGDDDDDDCCCCCCCLALINP